jgi:hypothetical protein
MLILIFGLFLLSNGSENIQISLLDNSSEKKEFKDTQKRSRYSQKEIVIELEPKPQKKEIYAILKRNHIIGIIFSFLGAELSKIIKLAPSKISIKVMFGHYVAKYVAKTLKKQNYVVPTFLWKNEIDLPTIQFAASEYIEFNENKANFVAKNRLLQTKIHNLTETIDNDLLFKIWIVSFQLAFCAFGGFFIYVAINTKFPVIPSILTAVFYAAALIIFYPLRTVMEENKKERKQKEKLEKIINIFEKI